MDQITEAVYSNLENIEKKYKEQVNQIQVLKDDVDNLNQEFNLNKEKLRKQEIIISELQAKCHAYQAEIESVQLRHKIELKNIQNAQDSLNALKQAELEIQQRKQKLKDQILGVQFEITKLSEQNTVFTPNLPDRSEITQLKNELQVASNKVNQVNSIVMKIGQECKVQYREAEKEMKLEIDNLTDQIKELKDRNFQYQTALVTLQNSYKEKMDEINCKIMEIKNSTSSPEEEQYQQETQNKLTFLQQEINHLNIESQKLEKEIAQKEKVAEQIRITFQNSCEHISAWKITCQEKIQKNETRIKTQKAENSKLLEELTQLQEKLKNIQKEIVEEENGVADKPDFDKIYSEKIAIIQNHFNKCQTKYKEKMKKLSHMQKKLEDAINERHNSIETIINKINQTREASKKLRSSISHIKVKVKETKKEIANQLECRNKLEDELSKLQPPIPDQNSSYSHIVPLTIPSSKVPVEDKSLSLSSPIPNNNVSSIPSSPKQGALQVNSKNKGIFIQLTTELNELTTSISEKQQELQQLVEKIKANEIEMETLKSENAKMENELSKHETDIEPMRAMYHALLNNQEKLKTVKTPK